MPRIFVALPMPPETAAALARAVPPSPALRPVAPENLHVTLAFVGSIPEERVGDVSAAASRAAASGWPFDVVLGPLGRFPPSGVPRIIWAGLGSAAAEIEKLGATLRQELDSGSIPFDRKPLRPHVTLARVRERAAPDKIASAVAALDGAAVPAGLSFRADALHVIESRLSPAGPHYVIRSEHPLTGSSERLALPARASPYERAEREPRLEPPERPQPAAVEQDWRTPGLRRIENAVEGRLRELAEKGELSGLPGEGKPFPRENDLSGERWAAFHVMSNEKVLPAWAELRHEIDESAARLVARARRHLAWLRARDQQLRTAAAERIFEARALTLMSDQRVRAEVSGAVAELNDLVQRYEVAVPVASLQMPRFTVARIFEMAAREEP